MKPNYLTQQIYGDEWKQFDSRFPHFSKDIRNVRLGLSTDGFDPFRDAHAREYIVWPMLCPCCDLTFNLV